MRFLDRPQAHMRAQPYLFQLTLSHVMKTGSIGNAMEVIQCMHAGRQVGIAERLHGGLLQGSGKINVLCDATSDRELLRY